VLLVAGHSDGAWVPGDLCGWRRATPAWRGRRGVVASSVGGAPHAVRAAPGGGVQPVEEGPAAK